MTVDLGGSVWVAVCRTLSPRDSPVRAVICDFALCRTCYFSINVEGLSKETR